ncbi:M48 family metalloprotease [Nitrosomonas eutropha]|uniref:Zn-dependent protease n=3 Tax=Nitrosomonas eutropha TaxID=916 RepID=A0ABX5M9T7_9PROT|nr:M48 family metalloprotease [Nitrosomonas eutropha]PXV81729.1 putative Zn-dependent protease [Nitrosomonas eutropha]SCX11464.1 Putative Zn-dependent protease, contains TPR repeats [Nitrosomonas eutropha]SEI71125.1 Putative Zn-dependent protease, contains TPR repeats [Nitrosomonas eutropha]
MISPNNILAFLNSTVVTQFRIQQVLSYLRLKSQSAVTQEREQELDLSAFVKYSMKLHYLIIIVPLLFPAHIFGQELPDLGDVSQATVTPHQERQIGMQIMREIRADASYLDDPEITDYLARLGHRLISAAGQTNSDNPFEFFAIDDSSINAFALPGGFVGFHSGLITAAQNESELAGVMAHEIAHVTQKHLARMLSGSSYLGIIGSIAALAIAILASRSNPQAGQAVLATAQASAIQSQLNFTRKHEKEADRVGFGMLVKAGFDPHGMSTFFERMQHASRYYENGIPSYLMTHPVTHERIADIQNRTRELGYRQVPDSLEFHLVRAKIRASRGNPASIVSEFKARLQDKRYINEIAERYGLIQALLRAKQFKQADEELNTLYRTIQSDSSAQPLRNHRLGKPIQVEGDYLQSAAMIETLAARVKFADGQIDDAFKLYQAALQSFPHYRALVYDYVDALLEHKDAQTALNFINEQSRFIHDDIRLYRLTAQCHAALGNALLQHQAEAEALIREGNLRAAIEQLQVALRYKHDNFYQLSSVEARLRQIKEFVAAEEKNK